MWVTQLLTASLAYGSITENLWSVDHLPRHYLAVVIHLATHEP